MRFSSILPAFGLVVLPSAITATCTDQDLTVKTSLFSVRGAVSPNSTAVRVFKGIPYAEPPTGSRRFLPPVTKEPTDMLIDATKYAPACMLFNNGAKNVYNQYITGDLAYPGITQSEDCLYLNVWAPRAAANSSEKYAVMIWVHGGGFVNGNAANPYKEGTSFVKNQNVIIVSMDYRVNVFGFPNAAALNGSHLNVGLLDVRKAVEWTHANIAAFGGSPSNMILFGQSAGGAITDAYSYAYNTDPIVKGFISESGVSGLASSPDPSRSNFTFIAGQFNCTGNDDQIFKCAQKIPATDLLGYLNTYNATANGGRSLSFVPQPDNESFYSNYTERRLRGLYAQVPYLTGSNENEGASLIAYPSNITAGPNAAAVKAFTLSAFTCPTSLSARIRTSLGTTQWRYFYRGIYPNQNPLWWLGAYHSSEIPMVWGTTEDGAAGFGKGGMGPDTAVQRAMSVYMQSAWAAFAKNPKTGLSKYGWPTYDPSKETLIQLGVNGSSTAVFSSPTVADNGC